MPGDDRTSGKGDEPRVDREVIQGDAQRALDAASSEPRPFDLADGERPAGSDGPPGEPPKESPKESREP